MKCKGHIRLRVTGIVQGVGFRPFVYRIALKYGITGSVRNDTRGVLMPIHELAGLPPLRLETDEGFGTAF